MRYNKAIAQARSMLRGALDSENDEQVAHLVSLLLNLQKDYIFELEKERVVMMHVYQITLSNGAKIEVGARNEMEAKRIVTKSYDLFIMKIERIR